MQRGLITLVAVAILAGAHAPAWADPPAYDIGTLTFQGNIAAPAPAYDIGTLTFHGGGGEAAAPSYDIGTLTFHGPETTGAPEYDIGTLAFHGPDAITVAVAEYDIGTLRFAGKPRKAKIVAKPVPLQPAQDNQPPPPVFDLSKIFGGGNANAAPQNAPTSNFKLKTSRKLLITPPPSTLR